LESDTEAERNHQRTGNKIPDNVPHDAGQITESLMNQRNNRSSRTKKPPVKRRPFHKPHCGKRLLLFFVDNVLPEGRIEFFSLQTLRILLLIFSCHVKMRAFRALHRHDFARHNGILLALK
jgi:hypothetical protein